MNATTEKSSKTYTIHSLDEIKIDTRVRALAALNESDARTLTTQIQQTSVRLWLLVTEAHDRKAHLALGYETWADYVKAELNMSESRSYQFLDTGHVMKALAGAGVDIETFSPPPVRVIARIKDRLTDVKKVATEAIKKDEDVDKAVRALAREPRARSSTASDVAAASSNGGGEVVEMPKATRGATTSCPACAGTGKVTKTVAERLLALIQKM